MSFRSFAYISLFLYFLLYGLSPFISHLPACISVFFCRSTRLSVCLPFIFPLLSSLLYIFIFPLIKVIGDKQGGNTALALSELGNLDVLQEINQVVQVPMKFIHVHRNPFDNIATMMLRAIGSRGAVREEGVIVSNVLGYITFRRKWGRELWL